MVLTDVGHFICCTNNSLGKLHNNVSLVQNTFSYNMQIDTFWLQPASFKAQTISGLSKDSMHTHSTSLSLSTEVVARLTHYPMNLS